MAPHLSSREQDLLIKLRGQGVSPQDAHSKLAAIRRRQGIAETKLAVIHRFFRGATHRRGSVETRGRPRKLTNRNVRTMNRVRKALIKKNDGTRSIHWKDIVKKSRVPKVHATTAARAFSRAGLDVKYRPCRMKPRRTPGHEKERKDMCLKMSRYPKNYFTERVDMIIDNKLFSIPTTAESRQHAMSEKVHGQLRLRSEGLQKGFTKPNPKRHRRNLGGHAIVCAGISKNRVVLWEYVTGRWCGKTAAQMYKGPIMTVMKKKCGTKDKYLMVEDNDPQGYKSSIAKEMKKSLGIRTVPWPRYSPDLNPLDFGLWQNIEKRMLDTAPKGRETAAAYKKRLRRTALSTPTTLLRSMLESIRDRAKAVYEANGGDIVRD